VNTPIPYTASGTLQNWFWKTSTASMFEMRLTPKAGRFLEGRQVESSTLEFKQAGNRH